MVYWGKCKYIMMVKMKSGYRMDASKRLESVVGAMSKKIVCHVCHGEFGLHPGGHRRTIEEF